MIPGLKRRVEEAIAEACRALWGVPPPRVVLETPPKVELGDVAIPVAFELAKVLRRSPRKIAEELAPALVLPDVVASRTVEGGGYVNLRLDRPRALAALLASAPDVKTDGGKVIVEHTNINPNKAAHIGHLRNAVLGDVLVRNFRRLGRTVETQNYLDDTGVQVADVVVGLLHAKELDEPERACALGREIEEILAAFPFDPPGVATRRLGDLTWDLYALVGRTYAERKELEKERSSVLHAIEGAALRRDLGAPERGIATRAARLAEAVVRVHLTTMARIGVSYDLLPRESDILGRHFWTKAFELLKESSAARLETEGKNAGCWVMPLEGSPEFEGMEDADKILVRSNGTVTYTGKDVAYQLWKLGALGIDFEYEPVPYRTPDGAPEFLASDGKSPLYRTRHDEAGADPSARGRFGHAASVINVIDVRQSYPQKVVKEAVRRAGFPELAARSTHFSYEMVALTPASAEALGVELSEEDRARPFIEMSGRKGLGVKADDLIDSLVAKATEQIELRELATPANLGPGKGRGKPGAGFPEQGLESAGAAKPLLGREAVGPREAVDQCADRDGLGPRAEAIAIGALRVYMTRFSRNKVIAFDLDEALAFEGDTGPYLQYAAVRAEGIFRKLGERGMAGRLSPEERQAVAALPASQLDDALWDVVRTCARTDETFEKVAETLEVSLLVRHALAVAGAFHHLYHTHPILQAEDDETRRARRAALQLVADRLADVLGVLGVPIPEKM